METLMVSSISYCCLTKLNSRNFNLSSLFSPSFPNSISPNSFPCSNFSTHRRARTNKRTQIISKSATQDEWLKSLPDKKKPLYSHSLPCVEAWLKQLGFFQSNDDRAVWFIEKPDWHAKLSLDVTDLYIRYLKSGPGNLDKDMERRFSYALSREDIENAILGGP
ncbi:uncharacterized protein LOC111918017 [Lactuca sativa]|uniref:Uncharacterized protein n=1 Tax=Lactuca sativa TaxID=4236 RepID=A0A9R1UDY7_LACSA|nr:uncharacterized protein LOC111918017 [Lactuca sativa]KAJ0185352.1 hypothetical protein LSAT_V11C900479960 [Lactuca sativa]